MSKGTSRKWGGKSLQNLFLNSKENMKQQHIASVNSPATVLETAVYINVLAHVTACIALDSSPKDRNRAQPCRNTQRKRPTQPGTWAALLLQLQLAKHMPCKTRDMPRLALFAGIGCPERTHLPFCGTPQTHHLHLLAVMKPQNKI